MGELARARLICRIGDSNEQVVAVAYDIWGELLIDIVAVQTSIEGVHNRFDRRTHRFGDF